MTGELLDLGAWPRTSHYELFRGYENPFFNICTEVRVTDLYAHCRLDPGASFFLRSLHACTQAANEVEAFRLRLRAEGVWIHDRIHAGSTVLRRDGTFGFAYFDFVPELEVFEEEGRRIMARVREETGDLDPRDDRDDLLHFSVIPWIRFSSFSHARRRQELDSVPKIVFGKHHQDGGERRMPVSVEVHHALADGVHVARFLDRFQDGLEASAGDR